LYEEFQTTRLLFEEASDTLKIDFQKLCFTGDETELAKTENTQPVLLLVSTCCYKILNENTGFKPQMAAGHSIGEYAAVVAAGALALAPALKAVRRRGEEMQKAVPIGHGGMAAVMGLQPEQVIKLCRWAEAETQTRPLEPANFNAPGQIV